MIQRLGRLVPAPPVGPNRSVVASWHQPWVPQRRSAAGAMRLSAYSDGRREKHMNWEAIGAIGEVLGAIGVIATLGYLAAQIRQNTRSVRASTYQEAVRDMVAPSDLLASDAELARIWTTGKRDFDALKPDERQRYAAYMLGLLRRFENVVYQKQHAALDPSFLQMQISLRDTLSEPGAAAWWARAQYLFSPSFREYVGRELTRSDETAAQQGASN